MEVQQYLSEKKKMQDVFLGYIDDNKNVEEHFQNLLKICNDQNIKNDINEFRLFMHFINNIANNHFRAKDFFFKIEKILLTFKDCFQKNLSSDDIYLIFEGNKRIILFLLENKFIDLNSIKNVNDIDKQYFSSEINKLNSIEEVQNDPNFDENRKKGENLSPLANLIRNSSISDFIKYIKKNKISLKATIETSIYETNPFLIDKTPTLIEYSAFFGSIQVFTYLFKNKIELTPSLWLYAVHGRNPEIFKILEDEKVVPEDETYEKCLIEALQCHHNDVIHHIKSNFLSKENQIHIDELLETESIDCYNFSFFPDDNLFNKNNFYKFCKYDYYFFADQYLANHQIDINFETCDNRNGNSYINTSLIGAIENKSINIVKLLLKQPGIDVNHQSITFFQENSAIESLNPLDLAVINGSSEIVQLLLDNENIDVNSILTEREIIENKIHVREYSILRDAIAFGDIVILNLILNHPDINVNIKIKEKIYEIGDQTNMISSCNKSILEYAIDCKNYDMVKVLLKHPKIDINMIFSNENKKEETFLIKAIKKHNHELIKILLEHPEIDVNKSINNKLKDGVRQETPLTTAISLKKKDDEIISLLLNHKNIDVNMPTTNQFGSTRYEETPLSIAIDEKNKEIIVLLLTHPNIDVNCKYVFKEHGDYYYENCELFNALEAKMDDIVLLMLDHPKIDVNVRDYYKKYDGTSIEQIPFLHKAIKYGNIEIIKKILEKPNVDVNIKSFTQNIKNNVIKQKEKPALFEAIKSNNINIVHLFLSKEEIDINFKSIVKVFQQNDFFVEEKSPLQLAIKISNHEIIRFLILLLRKSGKLKDDLKEIMKGTDDNKIKAIIYENINKQS
ncbi:hypothetical protein M9Y10_039846 [Tritrichomonas musculus]|uniref:DUF3447 domain-containing protein n=1 Tax=Tritrichomonas musculus TaxID=1915356 RepID=A0ABR2GQM2_9EUKA